VCERRNQGPEVGGDTGKENDGGNAQQMVAAWATNAMGKNEGLKRKNDARGMGKRRASNLLEGRWGGNVEGPEKREEEEGWKYTDNRANGNTEKNAHLVGEKRRATWSGVCLKPGGENILVEQLKDSLGERSWLYVRKGKRRSNKKRTKCL